MLLDLFTKQDTILAIVLFLATPPWAWVVFAASRRVKEWHAAQSEVAAKSMLVYLYGSLENPPTPLLFLAYIIFFLPIPIALTAGILTFFLVPIPLPHLQIDPALAREILRIVLWVILLVIYALFGVLAVYGIQAAYWLRHGEARFSDNYRAGIRKRIDRLEKKFPQLRSKV
jgi:hypothetical protein